MPDVLTQARTPTLQEVGQVSVVNPGCDCGHCESVVGRVLELAAPRILALAYREAARVCREEQRVFTSGMTQLESATERLEALATALEEGT